MFNNRSSRSFSYNRHRESKIPISPISLRSFFILFYVSSLIAAAVTVATSKQNIQVLQLRDGIAIDFDVTDSGSIVVGNIKLGTIDVYASDGHFERAIKPPVDVTDYFSPGAISTEGNDIFWVVDTYTGRVMRYLTDGNFIASFLLNASGVRLRNAAAIAVLKGNSPPEIEISSSNETGDSPETVTYNGGNSKSAIGLSEEQAAVKEGRIFIQRPDGAISTFSKNGNWIYDLPSPGSNIINTPAGIVLDYPLLWSLDYESRKVYIYDLERRENAPGTVSVKGIPDDAPICGLSNIKGESLLVVTGGAKPLWIETDNGWKSAMTRKINGSQPPVVRVRNSKLYILDRDSNLIEVYNLDEVSR